MLLAVLPACGPGTRSIRPEAVGQNDTSLGVDDVFEVRVFGEAELSGSYRVGQDGTIDFPLIGEVTVLGAEPRAVAALVATRLREGGVLVAPQVSVFVQEYNSKRFSVLGAVGTPGNFEMRSGMTVVQAIGLAGGFSNLANRDGTYVTRQVSGRAQRFSVPVDRITSGQEEDFPLQAQDIVYVPERIF
ncbi:MAG: polysaccharide export protein [Myxococcota bacterium]|nr:polysaccharide export protein [Myxococcota bacterium]